MTWSGSIGDTLVAVARANPEHIAVVCPGGGRVTFGALLSHAETLADALKAAAAAGNDAKTDDSSDILRGARVAMSATPGPEYVSAMHAAWMCGAIAVPVARAHSRDELEYVLHDAGVTVMAMIADATPRDYLQSLGVRTVETPPVLQISGAPNDRQAHQDAARMPVPPTPPVEDDAGALIIYTSGTTGRPKGVLHTHGTLAAQCAALTAAWAWSPDDVIYHALPLHHIHGIVNAWMCAHAVGACVEFGVGGGPGGQQFAPRTAWSRLRGDGGGEGGGSEGDDGDTDTGISAADSRQRCRLPITVFMGVPTMYVMMLRTLEGMRRTRPEARIIRWPI